MVKKCIIALAVAALMVTTVQAGDPVNPIKKDGNWPFTFKALPICTMDVFMDVGHFVQIKDCDKRELKLVQVPCSEIGKDKFPCYKGCEEFEARANFPAIFGGEFKKDDLNGKVLNDTKVIFPGDDNQIDGSTGDWEKFTICLIAWEAQIWKADKTNDKLKVGELTITVKPPDSDA